MRPGNPRQWVFCEHKGKRWVRNHRWKLYDDGRLIDRARITTVSYGKERPIDPRSTEEAWSMNRNSTTTIKSVGPNRPRMPAMNKEERALGIQPARSFFAARISDLAFLSAADIALVLSLSGYNLGAALTVRKK